MTSVSHRLPAWVGPNGEVKSDYAEDLRRADDPHVGGFPRCKPAHRRWRDADRVTHVPQAQAAVDASDLLLACEHGE